jgi:TIR domain
MVDLTRVDLSGTDVSGAHSQSTVFGNVDLSTVRGLDTLEHCGPSTLGIDTLYRSHGHLPEGFLWGAGVPEDFITDIRSLVGRAVEFYACVLSYHHTAKPFARRLHDPWQGRGMRCWLDEHSMRPGDDIDEEIDRGIRFRDTVLRCCSQASLTRWWVDHDITKAFETERRLMKTRETKVRALIPLTRDGCLCTWMRGNAAAVQARMAADWTGWKRSHPPFERAFTRVIQARRAEEGGRAPLPTSKR